jgi:hypothetical protein
MEDINNRTKNVSLLIVNGLINLYEGYPDIEINEKKFKTIVSECNEYYDRNKTLSKL